MNILKKPIVAILLSAVIVSLSSVISIDSKLTNQSDEVINGFYYGARKNGQLQQALYNSLNELCDLSAEIGITAENYGISTKDFFLSLDELQNELDEHSDDIDTIYDKYETFYNALFTVVVKLSDTELSQRHLEFMSTASAQINTIKHNIENSGYNESVASFYKKYDRFPANFFADVFDIDYPEYFA